MGTLLEQPIRKSRDINDTEKIIREIEYLKDIQKKTGLTYEQVIDTFKMFELRRKNDLYVSNGDIFDEQMAGFGDLLIDYTKSFKEAFGVTQNDDSPKFLESIAMELGASKDGHTIKDALYAIGEE